jgi:DNA-directed RNA polymerase subunit RPC12/RpoP
MPEYDYKCIRCSCLISIKATVQEKTDGLNLRCPHCGSDQMEQQFHSVNLATDSKAVADHLSEKLKDAEINRDAFKKSCGHGNGCRCQF